MMISSRPYTKNDFSAISQMLIESYNIRHALDNWSIRHWEGQAFHKADLSRFPENPIRIWETNGKLIAMAHAESTGSAFFQVLPDYRQIEPSMLEWAEHHLALRHNGDSQLETWAYDDDLRREDLLDASGYDKQSFCMNCRRADNFTVPSATLAEGYQIRGMRREFHDCIQMAALLNAAFKRDFHKPEEYANFQTAPHYRPELDLVAIASDGTLVANAQVTLIHENGYAEFEPVCTHPEHQRKGLAKALMAEGLRLLKNEGIKTAFVDAAGDNPASNALYESMGFTQVRQLFVWKKAW